MIKRSASTQGGGLPPTEFISHAGSGSFKVQIITKGAKSRTSHIGAEMDLFVIGSTDLDDTQEVTARSINDPSSHPDTFAVGAVCHDDDTIEAFSSRGPTIDGRIKPDISAPDSTSSVTFGAFSGSCPSGAAGTSFSAPHAVGVAALLLQTNAGADADRLEKLLKAKTRDLGDTGADNIFGKGVLDLGAPPYGACNGLDATIIVDAKGGTVNGTTGPDVILGSGNDDVIFGDDGKDHICGGNGDDEINGKDGNDQLFGDRGEDTLRGGNGKDLIEGGKGNDQTRDGAGNDTVRGGDGNGRFIDDAGDDTYFGQGGGGDRIDKRFNPVGVTIDLDAGEVTESGAVTDTFTGIEQAKGSPHDDVVLGTSDRNVLLGNDGDDTLQSLGGDDTLKGNAGDDILKGGSGNDILIGAGGDDDLRGARGTDDLNGGPGTDICRDGETNSGCETIKSRLRRSVL